MRSIEQLLSAVEAAAAGIDFPCDEVYLASPSYSASWACDRCNNIEWLLLDLEVVWKASPQILQRVAEDDEAWIEFNSTRDDTDAGDDGPATVWRPLYSPAGEGHASALNVSEVEPAGKLPRFWRLFSYLLPRKTRERVFEPAYQELLEDYLTTHGKYRTKWAKRWLTFCYTFRTVVM